MTIQPEFPEFQVQEDSGDGLKSLIPNCNLTCRPQSCTKQRCCSDTKISNDDLWKKRKIMILLYILPKRIYFTKKMSKVGKRQCGSSRMWLPLRFYVKSILSNSESKNCNFECCTWWFFSFWWFHVISE